MTDVEMKPAEDKTLEENKKEEQKPAPISPAAEIKMNVALIDRAVSTLEPRFTHRVLRTLTALRKRIDESILRDAIVGIYPPQGTFDRFLRDLLLTHFE
jgi:26S proteasome regulatory subunit N3